MTSEANDNEELTIDQEYELWKKNCHFMYDYVYESNLKWPSLSVQWFSKAEKEESVINSELLIGTNTSGEDKELVKVVGANLPSYIDGSSEDQDQDQSVKVQTKITIKKKLNHDTEVNRARYMPQDENIIASIAGSGSVSVYDRSHSKDPILSLNFHQENGYGLDWSPFKKGFLVTGADDKAVCVWDINGGKKGEDYVAPYADYVAHDDIVNDVKWHKFNENMFASVSDDCKLALYDLRVGNKPASVHKIHSKSINSLAFPKFSQNLLACGFADSTIGLFDLRHLDQRLHTMMGHSSAISSLEWSPHQDGFLASGSEDRRVIIWDISKIGEEQSQDDADDGAPELFMMHAGHRGLVTDISWHPTMSWMMSSVSDDNVIQLWKPSRNITDIVDGWAEGVDLADLD